MQYISSGLSFDHIAGPFSEQSFSPFVSSPLGIVPKSEPGKFRIIHDLLYPKNNSVNTNIPKENSVVQYDTINWVINMGATIWAILSYDKNRYRGCLLDYPY